MEHRQEAEYEGGPVDLDEILFEQHVSKRNGMKADDDDDGSLFGDEEEQALIQSKKHDQVFSNPRRLLDRDASQIPGSPFSKPPIKRSTRPTEPLAIAKYASTAAILVTFGWLAVLFVNIFFNDVYPVGRIIVECILSALAFLGLFWNSYFISAMFLKCFIPAQAFKTNTKYCSIIPEPKPEHSSWLNVTIQIPVYKESLYEVLMPTLKSCQAARDHYGKTTTGRCNIVICDDGMMAMLRDNFPAAELLWKSVQESQGRVVRLSRLLANVPRASRRHLKGLRSKDVYEVFHRMLYYYHYNIGFVARSTVERRGKFKKASNLNSHLRLALGAQQLVEHENGEIDMETALLDESHNSDGSRYVMFGNDVGIGDLICVNDADARMAESVIGKTVPEFLNDPSLGFTQHATKTMNDQRGENYFTNLLAVYTDALYMGHFLLSSIIGCHPPLVGHSIFLRTEALNQCGRMRTLRKAQRWLKNIGLPFLPVDQIGFGNLHAQNRTEYWSESHVSEDFELMIHFYNLGFNGRYCAYPDCEFQEGITRTFDEEAGRHRKFSLGAHELVFNNFQEMLGHGIFTPLFRTFLRCDIPSYYKVYLTAYLCSYTSGGTYLIVFTAAALVRIIDNGTEITHLSGQFFSPTGIIILNFIIYFVLGYATFLVSLIRMHYINNKLLFPEYRKKCCGAFYIVFVMLRYGFIFQFLFYNVTVFTFYFLGSMDHMLARPGIVSATNKDSISISRCRAFWDMAKFNLGSWAMALFMAGLGYVTILEDMDWNFYAYPKTFEKILQHALFAGPPVFLAILAFVVPIILNPWVIGWPFLRKPKKVKPKRHESTRTLTKKDPLGREIVDIPTFMNAAKQLNTEMERVQNRPNVELGSLATKEFTVASPSTRRKQGDLDFYLKPTTRNERQLHRDEAIGRMQAGPAGYMKGGSNARQRKNVAEEV